MSEENLTTTTLTVGKNAQAESEPRMEKERHRERERERGRDTGLTVLLTPSGDRLPPISVLQYSISAVTFRGRICIIHAWIRKLHSGEHQRNTSSDAPMVGTRQARRDGACGRQPGWGWVWMCSVV